MATQTVTDPRFKQRAYVKWRGRCYEVLAYERTGIYQSELWLEDIGTFEKLALNFHETRHVELVRAAALAA